MKILQKEVPAIAWLVGAIAQDETKKVIRKSANGEIFVGEVSQTSFSGVGKDVAMTLLKFHFATIKKGRGDYTVTLSKRGTQFISNLLMLMGMNPRPADKKLEKHIVELAKQIEA